MNNRDNSYYPFKTLESYGNSGKLRIPICKQQAKFLTLRNQMGL